MGSSVRTDVTSISSSSLASNGGRTGDVSVEADQSTLLGTANIAASTLFGGISGSAVANVMVDGPISIPLMKRTGFKPHFAAAVEAVCDTLGKRGVG